MEKEDCIAIAKSIEVRALETSDGGLGGLVEPLRTFHMSEIQLKKFAKLVEQSTLERSAKVCWDTAMDQRNHDLVKLTASKLMQQINLLKDSNE